MTPERDAEIRKMHAERLAVPELIRQDAESAIRTCEQAWKRNERAVVTMGAGFVHLLAQDALTLLEALAVLGRQLAEKDEALRSILDVTTGWIGKRSASSPLSTIDKLAREALRAEPAKEQA